jgi:hypothetical protein
VPDGFERGREPGCPRSARPRGWDNGGPPTTTPWISTRAALGSRHRWLGCRARPNGRRHRRSPRRHVRDPRAADAQLAGSRTHRTAALTAPDASAEPHGPMTRPATTPPRCESAAENPLNVPPWRRSSSRRRPRSDVRPPQTTSVAIRHDEAATGRGSPHLAGRSWRTKAPPGAGGEVGVRARPTPWPTQRPGGRQRRSARPGCGGLAATSAGGPNSQSAGETPSAAGPIRTGRFVHWSVRP